MNGIDEYIAQFPQETQEILQRIRKSIKDAVPNAIEKLSYGMPTFYLNGNLVHFAAWKNHIGFYPQPKGIEVFSEDLAKYEKTKGTVKFPLDEPIPYQLIKKIAVYRAQQNTVAKRSKKADKK
jgi:uncharacterized protein YdhG (YjbR/CyaY superfamily)